MCPRSIVEHRGDCCAPSSISIPDRDLRIVKVKNIESGEMSAKGNLDLLDVVGFRVGHKVSPVLAGPTELEEAVQRHYAAGGGRGAGAPSRPEVQEVPELLMFELKATTPAADLDFSFGPTSGDPALVSAQAALHALTKLLSVLMDQGIISREEVASAIRKLLNAGEDEILLLENEAL